MFEIVKKEFRRFPNVEIILPRRQTKGSAGYDFYSNEEIMLEPGQQHTFWTDIKCNMDCFLNKEFIISIPVLDIYIRSSLGKKGLRLCNQVGIVDMDYYNNKDNDGNIGIMIQNTSYDNIEIKKGDRIAQGIIRDSYIFLDEIKPESNREGGFGHTNNNQLK